MVQTQDFQAAARATDAILQAGPCGKMGCKKGWLCAECVSSRLKTRVEDRRRAAVAEPSPEQAAPVPVPTQASQTSTGWTKLNEGQADEF